MLIVPIREPNGYRAYDRRMAVGVVAAGLTVSLVIGVPLGSWIGGVFGWPATFLLVVALTVLAVLVTAVTLPWIPAGPQVRVRGRLVLLRRPAVLSYMVGTVISATAGFMPYTFIAPVLTDVTGADRALVPVAIGVIGVAGALGTVIGGRLNDRWGADRTILIFLSVIAGMTILLALVGPAFGGRASFWLVVLLLAVWGAAVWGHNPPMNT